MKTIKGIKFIRCAIYLAIIGIASHFFGEAIPRNEIDFEKFPFRPYKWENDGRIYEKLKIRKWKNKVPDMSKICKDMIPKKLDISSDSEGLRILILETCVAEIVHSVLALLGAACLLIWEGTGGFIVTFIWIVFGNIPFIIIQRYNRPKLIKTYNRLYQYENTGKRWLKRENANINV